MAIDTAAKQMAMLNFWDGNNIHVLPIPDGAYSAPDQQHLLDLYSGIAFDSPTVGGVSAGSLLLIGVGT